MGYTGRCKSIHVQTGRDCVEYTAREPLGWESKSTVMGMFRNVSNTYSILHDSYTAPTLFRIYCNQKIYQNDPGTLKAWLSHSASCLRAPDSTNS